MTEKNLIIVGGGPAGLAAAVAAKDAGEDDILVLEREHEPGGILNQCIHNGFGLHTFKKELTGPEYAERYIQEVNRRGIEIKTDTTVLDIDNQKIVTFVSARDGICRVRAKVVILACGCRERPRGAINIAGMRGAGVYTAGLAQKLVNIEGYLPGKEVVILGSGDIGLIMARRMTFEGAKVKAVVELMPFSSGLNRNIVQCLDDFNIPLLFNHTVIEIKGKDRVTGVVIAEVDERLQPKPDTAQHIPCDTLLLSVGLLPENELAKNAGVTLSDVTGGAVVDDNLMTNIPGVFQCGNVLHVHDLVDFVSEESAKAGECAASYIKDSGGFTNANKVTVSCGGAIRYCVPQSLNRDGGAQTLTLRMRVSKVAKKAEIKITADGTTVLSRKYSILTPGEMETITLKPDAVKLLKEAQNIVITT